MHKCKNCGRKTRGEFCSDECERDYIDRVCKEFGIQDEIPDDFELWDDTIPGEY